VKDYQDYISTLANHYKISEEEMGKKIRGEGMTSYYPWVYYSLKLQKKREKSMIVGAE